MQLSAEKSKLYDRSEPVPPVQLVPKPTLHKRNQSCFVGNLTPQPFVPTSPKVNFIQQNREKAKHTEIASTLSQYYLSLKEDVRMKEEQAIRHLDFLRKASGKPSQRLKHSETQVKLPQTRQLSLKQSKKIGTRKQILRRERELLICKKVHPLLKTKYHDLPLNMSWNFILKSYQALREEYESNKYLWKINPLGLKYSIYKLKEAIRKVEDRLIQTESINPLEDGQRDEIDQYKRILATINDELEEMHNTCVEKSMQKNQMRTLNTQSTAAYKIEESYCINPFNSIPEIHPKQTLSHQKTQPLSPDSPNNPIINQNKGNILNPVRRIVSKDQCQQNFMSFQESSYNSTASFQSQHEIDPWHNPPQIIHDCQETKIIQSLQHFKPSQHSVTSNSQLKKRVGLISQKSVQKLRKNSSFRKSELKFQKSLTGELSNEQRRGSVARFLQNKESNEGTSIHSKLEGIEPSKGTKRYSQSTQLKLNKKISKAHRASIREKHRDTENDEIKEEALMEIADNLISETNFIQSSETISEEVREEALDTVERSMKKLPSRAKRLNLRSSNPLCSLLMLNEIEEQNPKDSDQTQAKGGQPPQKANQYNPKYLYIDSNKSFTQNTKLLSQEIKKMKVFLEANNCVMDELFEITEDKEDKENKERAKTGYVEKRVRATGKVVFQQNMNEPIFITIKRNLRAIDSDEDEPDMRLRYNDLVPLYYTEYASRPPDWLVFNQPLPILPNNEDQLLQRRMEEGVKLKDMLYFNFQFK